MPHSKPLNQQRSRKVMFAVLYVCAGLFALGAIFTVTSTFTIVDSIREDQKVNASTNKAVLDCTTPSGDCAKESRERTANVVDNIGRLSVYASACAADVDGSLPVRQRVKIIERCVTELLEAQQPAAVD